MTKQAAPADLQRFAFDKGRTDQFVEDQIGKAKSLDLSSGEAQPIPSAAQARWRIM
ncbi:hypothetical protein GRI44_13785 [Altererythrobacter confluentis]|uniref:Uncharacterized protein n=1 Tax=Allopontixanthobacter confluentis TaxID=1849021 RepID=A0A6L7GJY6_9SPHN|nr:hypothetical protein [Allopontixanthobacter confluentis]MXP15820.1 hypothetical protein [Allopontixanthobacter confluentis]